MGQWPVYFLLTFIILCDFEKHSVFGSSVPRNERNGGTVLFDKSTSCNHCWTKEELVILSSRKAFQDLLPEIDTSKMQDDRHIATLLGFIATCLDRICSMSVGKTKHLIVRSFADAIGGYLNSYVGPVAKVAFYAGNVDYRNIGMVFQLIGELRDFLHTNGAGWAEPIPVEMFINVTPIALPIKDASACQRLILHSASESFKSVRRKRREWKNRLEARSSRDKKEKNRKNRQATPFVFLPYFDNDLEPNSIALPFKDHNLWSLFDEESVAVLTRYYETCVQCIRSREDDERLLAEFDRNFYEWLQQSVYPHLSDDRWYPAFGGVLKIIAFLKGTGKHEIVSTVRNNNNTQITPRIKARKDSFGTWQLILSAVATAALVWLLVGLTLVCYKYRQRHCSECSSPCESPNSKETQYKNAVYCDPTNCPRLNDKGMREKVMDWCRRKINRSEDKCNRAKEQYSADSNCKSKESVLVNVGRKVYKKRKKSRRCASNSSSPSSSQYALYENKQFHYSSDMSSTNSEDSSYR